MKKYNTLIKIHENSINEQRKTLAKLTSEYDEFKVLLEQQYSAINSDINYFIDQAHVKAVNIRKKLQLLSQEIDKVEIGIKENCYKKKIIEKIMEKNMDLARKNLMHKEIVNNDNLATINYNKKHKT